MKNKKVISKPDKPAPKPCLGFRYTPQEEAAMQRAIKKSIEHMSRFGQGEQPNDFIEDFSCYTKVKIVTDRWGVNSQANE